MSEFKPIIYKSISEKRAAFLRAVNMRKEWEEKMRQKIAEMDANLISCNTNQPSKPLITSCVWRPGAAI